MHVPRLPRPAVLAALVLAAVLGGALTLVGCDAVEDTSGPTGERGRLVRSEPMGTRTPDELYEDLSDLASALLPGIGDPAALVETLAGLANESVQPVELHRLFYQTTDTEGSLVLASGVVSLPQNADSLSARPLALYTHGTIVKRTQVGSVVGFEDREVLAASLLLAADGYVTAMPDYLGLGAATLPEFVGSPTESFHPYIIADAYATASVDFLRAARAFAEQQGVAMTGELFVTGYSEGGYAAMVTHRAIQQDYPDEFEVTASGPMAGFYDVSGTLRPQLLDGAAGSSSYFTPYVLHSYDRTYDLFRGPGLDSVLTAPYAEIDGLFDGRFTGEEISALIGQASSEPLLRASFVEAVQSDPENDLRAAFRENDAWRDWAPEAPMLLGHGEADEAVPFQHSQVALSELQANGATDVELVTVAESALNSFVNVEGAGHTAAFVPLIFETKSLFRAERTSGEAPAATPFTRQAWRRAVERLGPRRTASQPAPRRR